MDEAISRIHPTPNELNTVITPAHLIDDYVLSRNIAKFGLHFDTLLAIQQRLGLPNASFHWHEYTIDTATKVERMRQVLDNWKVERALGPLAVSR